jgi:hypothetical protein
MLRTAVRTRLVAGRVKRVRANINRLRRSQGNRASYVDIYQLNWLIAHSQFPKCSQTCSPLELTPPELPGLSSPLSPPPAPCQPLRTDALNAEPIDSACALVQTRADLEMQLHDVIKQLDEAALEHTSRESSASMGHVDPLVAGSSAAYQVRQRALGLEAQLHKGLQQLDEASTTSADSHSHKGFAKEYTIDAASSSCPPRMFTQSLGL